MSICNGMASVVERDRARREEIIAAATACFLQFGFSRTSLDDIAKVANVSRPLLYRKFSNKQDIFAACYDATFQAQLEHAERAVAGPGTRAKKLEHACELVCIEPYEMLLKTPVVEEFWAACEAIIPEILDEHERKWRALLGQLLPKDLVVVFDLAIEGLHSDKPSVPVLRKRLRTLIARFV
jgi:AcrR family transcriptional regulator